MASKGLAILSYGLLFLTAGAAATLVAGARGNQAQQDREREFQHLVGGLGTGPAVTLSGCGLSFDARLSAGCQFDLEPIPGGVHFCPEHGCSILNCSPKKKNQEPNSKNQTSPFLLGIWFLGFGSWDLGFLCHALLR